MNWIKTERHAVDMDTVRRAKRDNGNERTALYLKDGTAEVTEDSNGGAELWEAIQKFIGNQTPFALTPDLAQD